MTNQKTSQSKLVSLPPFYTRIKQRLRYAKWLDQHHKKPTVVELESEYESPAEQSSTLCHWKPFCLKLQRQCQKSLSCTAVISCDHLSPKTTVSLLCTDTPSIISKRHIFKQHLNMKNMWKIFFSHCNPAWRALTFLSLSSPAKVVAKTEIHRLSSWLSFSC